MASPLSSCSFCPSAPPGCSSLAPIPPHPATGGSDAAGTRGPSQLGAAPPENSVSVHPPAPGPPASHRHLSPLAVEATWPFLPFCSLLSPSIWPWMPPVFFCCSAQIQIVVSTGTQKCDSSSYSYIFFLNNALLPLIFPFFQFLSTDSSHRCNQKALQRTKSSKSYLLKRATVPFLR